MPATMGQGLDGSDIGVRLEPGELEFCHWLAQRAAMDGIQIPWKYSFSSDSWDTSWSRFESHIVRSQIPALVSKNAANTNRPTNRQIFQQSNRQFLTSCPMQGPNSTF